MKEGKWNNKKVDYMNRRKFKRPNSRKENGKIEELIRKISGELKDSIVPITLGELNAFERKLVHRHFDHNPDVITRTYRHGEKYELRIFPVGNLKKYAEEKAQHAIETGEKVVLPHFSNYERYIIHDTLKDNDAVKSASYGEGEDRHIEIEPAVFGRGLKKIIKKIRLF
jgi:predicted RNA-binding protein Jag